MATKLKNNPITQNDLTEYLTNESDFAFELRCFQQIVNLNYICQHGGSYIDPVTSKTRQFDLRASQSFESLDIFLAIECKNLKPNFPILITCTPRGKHESFHELIQRFTPNQVIHQSTNLDKFVIRVKEPSSPYLPYEFVGKDCAQIGRKFDDSFLNNDGEIFSKWSQALTSAMTYSKDAFNLIDHNSKRLICVIPILVVPDETLWQANYNLDGSVENKPQQVERVNFFVNQKQTLFEVGNREFKFSLSHLEILTFTGLINFLTDIPTSYHSWLPSTM